MDRCLNSEKGFTLLEMIMAVALGAIVLLSAADLLINFANFSSNVVKSESSLMDTSLGAFEEIVYNISRANKTALGSEAAISDPPTAFPGTCSSTSCIQVRMDVDAATKTPSTYSDDVVIAYWLSSNVLYRRIGGGADVAIAKNVTTLTFSRPVTAPVPQNTILIVLEAQVQSGAAAGLVKEHLETTVISRSMGV